MKYHKFFFLDEILNLLINQKEAFTKNKRL